MMMPRLLYAHMIKNEESDRLSKVPPADCDIVILAACRFNSFGSHLKMERTGHNPPWHSFSRNIIQTTRV